MSKELLDILKNSGIEQVERAMGGNSIFDNVSFLIDKESYRCSINSLSLCGYELVLKAMMPESRCLHLLNASIDKKLKIPDIVKNKHEFIITAITIEKNGNFTLTAALANI